MKIDAHVQFDESIANVLGTDYATVQLDMDYVDDNAESVKDWIANELEEKFNRTIMLDEFEVTNLGDIIEAISFDEFQAKVVV